MTQAYPLEWPAHIKRTPLGQRSWGRFHVTPHEATCDLVLEVERSGGSNLVISSNMPVRRDGLPYANRRDPDDPGVAVYYQRKGRQVCIPCDSYDAVWKNIRAIGLSIRDMRGPEARGCASISDQAFSGFTALPPPDADFAMPAQALRQWHEVLGVAPDCPLAVAEGAWKALSRTTPEDDRREINAAINAARKIKRVAA